MPSNSPPGRKDRRVHDMQATTQQDPHSKALCRKSKGCVFSIFPCPAKNTALIHFHHNIHSSNQILLDLVTQLKQGTFLFSVKHGEHTVGLGIHTSSRCWSRKRKGLTQVILHVKTPASEEGGRRTPPPASQRTRSFRHDSCKYDVGWVGGQK